MSDKLTIHYSVENCGDGSAYPVLFETNELAEWHQDHLGESWGEPCTGEIVVEGDNLRCPSLQTKESYYLKLLLEGYDNADELNAFKYDFFPDGLPKFTVDILDTHHYGIYIDGRFVYKRFAYPEKKANNKGVKKLTKIVDN